MEEKSKEIKMEAKSHADESKVHEQSSKLTYEQLEQVAGNLQQQCRQLYSQLQNAQNTIAEFNEIGMLLDILGKSEHFSEEFISRCSTEIEEVITKALDHAKKAENESGSN